MFCENCNKEHTDTYSGKNRSLKTVPQFNWIECNATNVEGVGSSPMGIATLKGQIMVSLALFFISYLILALITKQVIGMPNTKDEYVLQFGIYSVIYIVASILVAGW